MAKRRREFSRQSRDAQRKRAATRRQPGEEGGTGDSACEVQDVEGVLDVVDGGEIDLSVATYVLSIDLLKVIVSALPGQTQYSFAVFTDCY